ncbi:Ltp family lipoprotein [Microbacterium sp. NPDC056044]|uniref:Ltp family lipoprotein n=1 Tax=Microbacterium sp. NPDC056044 TaxID=3345690 RepID=UPI0035DA5FC9
MSSTTSTTASAGWYAAGVEGQERYWDGAQWTEMFRQAPASAMAAAPDAAVADASVTGMLPDAAAPEKRWSARKKWVAWGSVAAGVLVFGMIGSAIGAGGSGDATADSATQAQQEQPAADEVKDTTVAVPDVVGKSIADARTALEAAGFTTVIAEGNADDWTVVSQGPVGGQQTEPGAEISLIAEAPQPVYSLEQQNALRSAESYLDFKGFSRAGLIRQLSSEYGEGYPLEVATWAADTVGADWNAEAAQSAQSYLDFQAFSRDGLYEQLTSEYGEGFTPDQANYALSQVGY